MNVKIRVFVLVRAVETKTVKIVRKRIQHERNMNELVHEGRTIGVSLIEFVRERNC
jgi:hypothetical protein